MIVLIILFAILIAANITPYIYSTITWNYGLMLITLLIMYTNFVVYLVMLCVYLLLPNNVIEDIIKYLVSVFKNVFAKTIEKTEKNIKDTFIIHIKDKLPERHISIWHPHGISGITPVIHNGYKLTNPEYIPAKGVVHSTFFMMPLIKDIIHILNAIPSDYASIKNTVINESVSLTIGGVEEMCKVKEKTLELVIKKRKGIFKIALETGTPIVPILTYGENEIFPESDNAFLKWLNTYVHKFANIRLPFPSIESLKNWLKLTTQPLDPIYTYTGRPIYVKKIENPTVRQIGILRKIYIQRVRELFKETNYGEYTLKIV
jgi:hypothetical protein